MGAIVRAVRGATTVTNNSEEDIISAVKELLQEMMVSNSLNVNDMISILFTLTPDLNAVFPAKAARLLGLVDVPLMCASEIDVKGALPMCIRVMILTNFDYEVENKEIDHVYLREATILRPDISGRNLK